jgi:hypothetical protein
LSKKSNKEGTTISNFKLYYRATEIRKKIQHGIDTKTDMKTNGSELNTQTQTHAAYSHLIFLTKELKTCVLRRKDSLFNKWCWEN